MKTISSDWISDQLSSEDRERERRVQEGRSAIITWLAGSRRSSGRIIDRLKQQNYSDDVIDQVVASLIEDGTIDDERLAFGVLKRCQGRRAESTRAMAVRMTRLGINQSVIHSILDQQADDLLAARSLIEARFELPSESSEDAFQQPSVDRKKQVVKAFRLLSARGFDRSIIFRALSDCGLRIDIDS